MQVTVLYMKMGKLIWCLIVVKIVYSFDYWKEVSFKDYLLYFYQTMLTIGVAVPCHAQHEIYIDELIENILMSTRKPQEIVISCSGWHESISQAYVRDGVNVQIIYDMRVLNAAQNRNIAGSYLTTDIITFIDVDDLMHPKRLEYILFAFENETNTDVVYHSYQRIHSTKKMAEFWDAGPINIVPSRVIGNPRAYGLMVEVDPSMPIHHAHLSLRRGVFEKIKFDENPNFHRLEDSVYGKKLAISGFRLVYMSNELSKYIY